MSLTLIERYLTGQSIPAIATATGIPRSTVRRRLIDAGVTLRSRGEALRIAPNLGSGLRGKKRTFTEQHKARIAEGRRAWSAVNATGKSQKARGYVEITIGPQKGRSEHVIIMEERLGRHLLPDEVVHHIDGDRSNNNPNNLALMTRGGHTRHHRMIERLVKCQVR